MRRRVSSILAIVVIFSLTGFPQTALAQQEQQGYYGETQQDTGAPTGLYGNPNSNIIGYQPMSQEQVEAVFQGYAARPAAGEVQAAMQPTTPGLSPNLPTVYLTGIVGDGPYTLGRDDVISISVRNQPEFSGTFHIGYDGRIQYNYFGDLPIAGMTKYEVQQILEKLLAKYIRKPIVNVQIVAYNSKVVYMIGEIARPGKYIMRGDKIKLRDALLAAGLPDRRRAAMRRVQIITPDLTDPQNLKVDVKEILFSGELKEDVDLHPGELVVIPTNVWAKIGDFLSNIFNPFARVGSTAARVAAF